MQNEQPNVVKATGFAMEATLDEKVIIYFQSGTLLIQYNLSYIN